jgi:chromosome segregation ATPase
VEELESTVVELETDKNEAAEKILKLEEELGSTTGSAAEEKEEIEKLRAKLELLEEKNRELQQEGLDFKTTILAAQKFADNLKMTSEQEAAALMEQARADVEKFRREAQAELAHLPREIEELQQKKIQVRDELKAMLNAYLQKLDSFGEADDDFSDLFQSIQIPEVESVEPDDMDNIDMELP